MTNPKIYIQEPWGMGARQMFHRLNFPLVDTPEECDIIVFNGGEDISPEIYGEKPIPKANVYFDQSRDKRELDGYGRAKDKFKFGICRGGQLLNCLNGGRLWQDVNNHTHAHDMLDIETGKTIFSSSIHHQQFILGPDAILVASAQLATRKLGYQNGKIYDWHRDHGDYPDFEEDPEVVFYEKDRALCIQGHPEYGGYTQMTQYCMELIKRYY